MEDATLGHLVNEALSAYEDLESLAQDVEDEWTYVTDLAAAWRERLGAVGDERATESVSGRQAAAIERAIAEIGLVSDPHRAIDWLSTFPQIVLVAIGARA